jgi:hypothetical protein
MDTREIGGNGKKWKIWLGCQLIDLAESKRSRTNFGRGIVSSHVFPGKSGDEGSPHEGAKYCFRAGNDLIHP